MSNLSRVKDWLLEQPIVYKTWQRPFVEQKLGPILKRGDIPRAKRVLDVGCGPGTNAAHFTSTEYLGIDINPQYIDDARRRYGDRFVVADVTQYSVADQQAFDFILVNSLLHHLATDDVRRLLRHLSTLLSADGQVHIIDLVMPPQRHHMAAYLARMDRGKFPRPLGEWNELFREAFVVSDFEEFPVGPAGLRVWSMVYCKGRAKST